MNQIKFGYFESEKENRHFVIILERENCVIKTGALIGLNSVNLMDVVTHRFVNEKHGDYCQFSPTGRCSMYDNIRWNFIDFSISPENVAEILIQRISRVTQLSPEEVNSIIDSINNPELFKEN